MPITSTPNDLGHGWLLYGVNDSATRSLPASVTRPQPAGARPLSAVVWCADEAQGARLVNTHVAGCAAWATALNSCTLKALAGDRAQPGRHPSECRGENKALAKATATAAPVSL